MDYNINFNEFEKVMGIKVKWHRDGYSVIEYGTHDGEEKSICKSKLVLRYIKYITELIGKDRKLTLRMEYDEESYSNGCEARIEKKGKYSSSRLISGGTCMENMMLSAMEGIISEYSKEKQIDGTN